MPQCFVRAPPASPRARETAILSRIEAGDATFTATAANVHAGLDPALASAAAHRPALAFEDLVERGLVGTEEAVALGALYRPACAKGA